MIDAIAELTAHIKGMEQWIKELAKSEYPETELLCQGRRRGNAHGALLTS